jgi:cyclophilin family peptidyl-prolyl cis-trans isomerase
VPYTIYDENSKPEARKHFRGSLSMANQNSPNTASSQFFLSLTPQPFLNENHTVFGRVIEGLDVMADLTLTFRTDEKGKDEPIEDAIPSVILSAKVIRKRDHDYQPIKVGSKSATSAENNESSTD